LQAIIAIVDQTWFLALSEGGSVKPCRWGASETFGQLKLRTLPALTILTGIIQILEEPYAQPAGQATPYRQIDCLIPSSIMDTVDILFLAPANSRASYTIKGYFPLSSGTNP
jgi:hypothetical protein